MGKKRRLLLCSMTVPWPDRPTQGLYHLDLAGALQRQGIETEILSPKPCVPRWASRLHPTLQRHVNRPECYAMQGVTIHSPRIPFVFPRLMRQGLAPRLPKTIHRICGAGLGPCLRSRLRVGNYDGLLVHGGLPWAHAAAQAAEEQGLPWAVIEHSAGDMARLSDCSMLAKVYRASVKQARAVLAVSPAMTEVLREAICIEHARTVLNGVACGPSGHPARPDRFVGKPMIVAAAHYYRRKGLEELVDAFAVLAQGEQAAQLVLVTQPPDSLRDRIQGLGISQQVHTVPPCSRDELMRWMSWADVFALPATSEAFGLVFAEAWACGTPTLMLEDCGIAKVWASTQLGGGSTAHEFPGWRVQANDINAMAAALRDAVTNPLESRWRGELGRCWVGSHLSWERSAAEVARSIWGSG